MLLMFMIVPPAVGLHSFADQRAETERPLEVHADDLVEQVLADVAQARVQRGHPGVVDQHVDPAELRVDRVDEPVAVVPSTDMRRHRQGTPTGLALDRASQLRARVELAARDHDVRAAPRQCQHHLATEAAAAAGDQRHLAGEVELHRAPPTHRLLRAHSLLSASTPPTMMAAITPTRVTAVITKAMAATSG